MEKNVNDVLQVFPWNKKQEAKFKIYYNKVKIIYNNSREITLLGTVVHRCSLKMCY